MQLVALTPDLAVPLWKLFEGDRPVAIRLWAILDGTTEGRLLVDDPAQPAFAAVQEMADGTVYVAGAPTARRLTEALAVLRQEREVVACLWDHDPLLALLPADPAYSGTAIDFTDRSPDVDLHELEQLASAYSFRRIDREIAPALSGFDYYVNMFGNLEKALTNTLGYCLLDGAAVVCEAVAGPFSRGLAELGVGTAEAYRRKGLAAAVSARVIREVEQQGYRAFWNAAQQNAGSVALARRLGFQTQRPFRVLTWPASASK